MAGLIFLETAAVSSSLGFFASLRMTAIQLPDCFINPETALRCSGGVHRVFD